MFFLFFLGTFFLSFGLTALVRVLMIRWRIVDSPKMNTRKIHKKQTPLGGGIAIFIAFFLVTCSVLVFRDILVVGAAVRYLVGLFIGGFILMIGGILDDKYTLSPGKQILFPICAALTIVFFGIAPDVITNPFGGVLHVDQPAILVQGIVDWLLLSDIVVFFWLLGMMFTTKFLDGLDGLTTGIVSIGAFMIFFVSMQREWFQPDVALLSLIFAGACLGFLVWNFHPAKIFLGEGGSLFLGFLLGSLAIMSRGKIATTLLVMGLPMFDVGRVIIRRIQKGRPIYRGDMEHLHFTLIKSGMSQRQAVFLLYAISFLFGSIALFLQSQHQAIALLLLFVGMMAVGMWLQRRNSHSNT